MNPLDAMTYRWQLENAGVEGIGMYEDDDVDTDDDLFLHGESFHSVEILTVLYHRIRGNATVEG